MDALSETPAPRHILVVDDDPDIRTVLDIFLSAEGFTVSQAEHGQAMRQILASANVDLVIVDLMLPGEDGLSLVRHLRDRYRLGIIMLTARGSSIDQVIGLEVGADDYVLKPFEPRELLARIRSVLRRVKPDAAPPAAAPPPGAAPGGWRFDREARVLIGSTGESVDLTGGEYDLLCTFADNPGKVLNREFLLSAVRNRDWEYEDRSIDILVARLRRKLEQDPKHLLVIKTVRGAGYVLSSRVV